MKRQSKTFLMERFREMGIAPATRHGQNFLIDLNLQQIIVDAAELHEQDVVLEVGTGTGSLTAYMAPLAAVVVTVELDSHLFELASEELLPYDNVVMLKQDALRNKNALDPRLLDALGEALGGDPKRRLKLVANLPYNIATPVLSNLLLCPYTPHSMVATIQRELADRIAARPGTKDYGALSVWIQSQCDVGIVRELPPTVFWPRPKVSSAIVRIVVDRDRRAAIGDLRYFHDFTRAVFLHRRKYLRANVVAAMKRHLDKEQVDELLARAGCSGEMRAEQLEVSALVELAQRAREAVPDWEL